MEPAELTPELDSIAIFKLGNQKFVNANDNTFHKGQCIRLRDMVGGIDVGLFPSGAHGPWPMFFTNFSLEEKEKYAALQILEDAGEAEHHRGRDPGRRRAMVADIRGSRGSLVLRSGCPARHLHSVRL